MLSELLGPVLGQQLRPFQVGPNSGCKKWARERAYAKGEIGKILDGAVLITGVTNTKIDGEDGLLSNVTGIDGAGSHRAYPIITVCNQPGGVAQDASGTWVPYGRCKALVQVDSTTVTIGRILRVDTATPLHTFVLDETTTRGVGYGYILEYKEGLTSGQVYEFDIWFSALPFVADVA